MKAWCLDRHGGLGKDESRQHHDPSGSFRLPRWFTASRPTSEVGLRHWSPVLPVIGFSVARDVEQALMSTLGNLPVSIATETDQFSFQFNSSGVHTASCGANVEHGVIAVGNNTDASSVCWKVKNLWGFSWSEGRLREALLSSRLQLRIFVSMAFASHRSVM